MSLKEENVFKRKNLIMLVLLLVIALVVSACGASEPAPAPVPAEEESTVEEAAPAEEEAAEEEAAPMEKDPAICNVAPPSDATEINMIGWSFPIMDFYADELMKCDDVENLDVNTSLLASADAQEQVRLALSAGGDSPFDIVHAANSGVAEWATVGWMLPLNDLVDKYWDEYNLDDIPQPAWDAVTIDGQIYGVPIVGNTLHLIYRQDVFDELGLEAPDNYDEVIEMCNTIGLDNPDWDMPFTVNLSAGWAWEIEFFQMLRAYDGDFLDEENNATFNSPEGVQAVEKLIEVADACMGIDGYSFALNDQEVALQLGTLPASNMWASRAANMTDPERTDLSDVIAYAPAPRVVEGGPRAGSAWNDFYMIPANTTNDPDLIFRIIMEAADEASQKEAAKVGMTTRLSAAEMGGPYLPAANQTIVEGIGSYKADPATGIVRAKLGEFLPLVGTGEMTAQEALDAAAEAYTEEAEAQGYIGAVAPAEDSGGEMAGSDKDPAICNVAPPSDATELNMIGWSFPIMDFYADELMKCDDVENLDVNTSLLASADAQEQVRLALSAGGDSPFDIVHAANSGVAEWATVGWMLPLNDLVDKYWDEYNLDDIPQPAWDAVTIDGQIYGVPIVGNTLHLIYRQDVFDELGLEAPDNYDEVIEMCNTIGLDNPDWDMPFTVNLSAGWAWEIEFFQMLRAYGGDFLDEENNATFNSPEGVQAVEKLIEVADACMGIDGYSFALNDQEVALQLGTLPASNMWASRAANMTDPERTDLSDVIAYAPAPRVVEGGPRAGSAWNDFYMIPANTTNDPDLIFRIIMEAADEASQKEAAKVGMTTRLSAAEMGGPYLPAANQTIVEGIGSYKADPATGIVRAKLGEFLPLVGTGEMTAQEALDAAAEAYTEEAEAQGYIK
jgi:multiple sugar transport system substrate-binding protein